MALTEQQFIELEGNIRKTFDAYFKKPGVDLITPCFNVIKDKKAQITDFTVGSMSRMTEWDGSVSYSDFVKGYTKQARPTKYSKGLQIDSDLYDDGEYREIKTRTNSVIHAVDKTLRYHSKLVWENAFSTTYTGPDSAALCSASHYTVPGADAQTNTFTLDLSYTNMETIQNAAEQWTDDNGDPMLVELDMVIAGPYWRKTCEKLFGSDKEAFTADNTKNVEADKKYWINPLITGTKWFYVNEFAMKAGDGLNFWMRKDPRNLETDSDFDAEILKWKAVGRWTWWWVNWHWLAGSNPS